MSVSGMRWGDSCSSDEDEVRVRLTKHESSSESDNDSFGGGRPTSQPPARHGSGSNGKKNSMNRRSGDDRWDNRGGLPGRGGTGSGRGGRQGRVQAKKSTRGGNGKKGGKKNQFSVTIGGSEWKEMAKDAKKYGGKTTVPKVEGNNWMALRQKKAEEKKVQEFQKREQEFKEKRKNQKEALKAAVEQKKNENKSMDKGKEPKENSDLTTSSNASEQPKKIVSSSLQRAQETSLNQLEQKMASQSLSSASPNARPKLLLKARTLPVAKADVVSKIPDDSKEQKLEKDGDKNSVNHDSEEDQSIITASSRSSLGGGRGDRRGDQRKRGGRGRGRGKGPHHSNSSLRQTKSNNMKKDRIPYKKPITVKGDLMPNGTVRLSKRQVVGNDGKPYNGDKKSSKGRDNNRNFKGGKKGDKGPAQHKKGDKNTFRQITKIEIGGVSASAQYVDDKPK